MTTSSTPSPSAGNGPSKPDTTQVDLTTPEPSSSPALPNDRDESQGMTGGVPSKRVQQGHRDLQRGVEDTTRGTEADKTYQKLKK